MATPGQELGELLGLQELGDDPHPRQHRDVRAQRLLLLRRDQLEEPGAHEAGVTADALRPLDRK